MLPTSARLLRLLALFQRRRYWSGAELCTRLEVTARTLRRDVDRLRQLGYPVDSTSGPAGGYQLGAGASLPPLLLEDDEAVAIAVGLRAASTSAVTGIEDATLRALTKLEQVLPARLRRRVSAVHTAVTPLIRLGPTVDADTIATIAAACRDHDRLGFRYVKRDGTEEGREVEPHQLVHTGNRWYLAAWDLARQNWRTFRADRIKPPLSLHGTFRQRRAPEGGSAAFVSRSVAYAPYSYRARVLLEASVEKMAETIPPTAGLLEPLGENRCRLSTGTHSLDALCVFIGLAGVDFEVEEPAELIVRLREMRARFTRTVDAWEAQVGDAAADRSG